MNWKKILQPTKGKVTFVILYTLFGLFYSCLMLAVSYPSPLGFPIPFNYYQKGVLNEFYPLFLLLDILTPIGIYIGIGFIGSRKSKE